MTTNPIDPKIEAIYNDIATYQAIAQQDYGVPEWQALPVASAPDIAFRPACSQLEPIWQADGSTAWVWDGQTIYSAPGELQSTSETLLILQAAGVCIVGSHAVDVPLVPTDEVFQEFQRQVSGAVAVLPDTQTNVGQARQTEVPDPEPVQAGGNWGMVLPIAGGVIALGLLALFVARKQSVKRAQNCNSEPAPQHPEAPTQTANGSVPLEEEYDFQL